MENPDAPASEYVAPRYRAVGDPAWYHMLHGTVPGYQIDFLYSPDVPQGRLNQGHLGHLSRLMKYIEPRDGAPFAFALGNLSRDDVQYEPGHGGVALIFALRVAGVTDHAGRAMPPYAHGVLAVDRELDYGTLLDAITIFYRRFLDTDLRHDDATGSFYRAYVRMMQERPEAVPAFLQDYVADFDELPQPPPSSLGFEWIAADESLPKRITIVHADDEPFSNIAHAAANLAAMLYKSNIKWTSITSGREIEIPGGISIRFVPASEVPRDARQPNLKKTASQDLRTLGAKDPRGLQVSLQDLPPDEPGLAHLVFGAQPRTTEAAPRANWRDALGVPRTDDGGATGSNAVPAAARRASNRPPGGPDVAAFAPPRNESEDMSFDEASTLQAGLEPESGAPAPGGAPPAAFDPRRSSSTKGIPSAFDPRRSSPMTGTAGVHAAVAPSAPDRPEAPPKIAAPAAGSPSRTPLLDSIPPPSLDGEAGASPMSEALSEGRSRIGVWIGVIGGIAVLIAVAVAVVTNGSGAGSSGDTSGVETGTTVGGAVTNTTPPAPLPVPPPTATAGATAGATATALVTEPPPAASSAPPTTVPSTKPSIGNGKLPTPSQTGRKRPPKW